MATAPIRLALRPHLPLSLTTVNVDPAGLIRVSNHNTGEPYFGKSGWNRFDDPHLVLSARYGTSYFGESLSVAVAETLLHDRTPSACCGVNSHDSPFLRRWKSNLPAVLKQH